MSNSIVDSVLAIASPQVVDTLATRLDGSALAVQTGLGTSVATLLSATASHTGNSGIIGQVFSLASRSKTQDIANNLTDLALGVNTSHAAEQGTQFTSLLFGGQQAGVESLIGRQVGLGTAAGKNLMALAAPLTVGFLAQQIREHGLTSASFGAFISAEAAKLHNMVPTSLGALISGTSAPAATGSTAFNTWPKRGSRKSLFALIALLLLALIGWLLVRDWSKSQQAQPVVSPTQHSAPATLAANSLGEFIKRRLPDGTELNIPNRGIENRLIDFIGDPSKAADKSNWFDFDRLTFDAGKATLQSSSSEQLQNIAAILKAYPKAKIKIGGYTDNTGNQQSNLKLSEDRAENVMQDLVRRGINLSRLEAKGYGQEYPVADNATEEGRQKNRRISLLVTAK